jgi:hypothetical protein
VISTHISLKSVVRANEMNGFKIDLIDRQRIVIQWTDHNMTTVQTVLDVAIKDDKPRELDVIVNNIKVVSVVSGK